MLISDAKKLAIELMAKHGVSDWTFDFDNAKRRFGACHYDKRKITLSLYLTHLNTEDKVRETILHEIAHALAGSAHGHDSYWRQIARSIGSNGERCYGTDVDAPKGIWRARCTNGCGSTKRYHRRRSNARCGKCLGPVEWIKAS